MPTDTKTRDRSNATQREAFDDDEYWKTEYRSRPYADANTPYDVYRPAYRYGSQARRRHPGKKWRDIEAQLEAGWATARDESDLDWRTARNACRDAWDRVDRFMRE